MEMLSLKSGEKNDKMDSILLEQLKNSQDDVIDIAEPRGFTLLGVMKSTRPVDGYVCLLLVQLHRSSYTKKIQ